MFKLVDKKIKHNFRLKSLLRPNKKIPVFRVTQSYLKLLVKPTIVFFQKKKNKCVPNLPKISDPLRETHLFFFYLALSGPEAIEQTEEIFVLGPKCLPEYIS